MSTSSERKGLTRSLKTFYGVGDFGFTLMSNIDTYNATYFFTNIAKFPLGIVTVMTTISAIVDAILSTMYGPILNKIKPKKWGRYRSWLILTPWMVPILYALQFVSIGNGVAAGIFVTLAMITSRIAWNIPFIANLTMINVAGKNPEDRMTLSSTRSVWMTLGSLIYSYAGPAVIAVFTSFLGEVSSYAATAFAFSVFMAAAYYAHFRMFKGYEMTDEEELAQQEKISRESGSKNTISKVKAMDVIKTNSHLLWLLGATLMKFIVLFLVSGIAIYYFTYVSHNEAMFSIFLFTTSLCGVVASYVSKFIVAKFGAKKSVVSAYVLMVVFGIIAFLFYQSTILVVVFMCLLMFMLHMSNAIDPELYAGCAGYSGKKLGYDVSGTVMGLLTVPLKIGIVFRGILIAAVLVIANFDASLDPASATVELQRGVSIGFMIIPAIIMALGTFMLAFGYKLSQEKN